MLTGTFIERGAGAFLLVFCIIHFSNLADAVLTFAGVLSPQIQPQSRSMRRE
jgi:hypothetical protein